MCRCAGGGHRSRLWVRFSAGGWIEGSEAISVHAHQSVYWATTAAASVMKLTTTTALSYLREHSSGRSASGTAATGCQPRPEERSACIVIFESQCRAFALSHPLVKSPDDSEHGWA